MCLFLVINFIVLMLSYTSSREIGTPDARFWRSPVGFHTYMTRDICDKERHVCIRGYYFKLHTVVLIVLKKKEEMLKCLSENGI